MDNSGEHFGATVMPDNHLDGWCWFVVFLFCNFFFVCFFVLRRSFCVGFSRRRVNKKILICFRDLFVVCGDPQLVQEMSLLVWRCASSIGDRDNSSLSLHGAFSFLSCAKIFPFSSLFVYGATIMSFIACYEFVIGNSGSVDREIGCAALPVSSTTIATA